MKLLLPLSIISLLMLTACASVPPADVDAKLTAWQGQSINTLIQAWGVPTQEREINGIKYAEWNAREVSQRPSVNVGVGGYGSHVFGSIGTTIFGGRKETNCLVQVGYNQEGTVISSNWSGDTDTCDAAIPEKL
ncbi:hypothetical protein [Kangiella sp. TOML190]|uniref:hypothetical protein n=1 Tax=Kangiella sp. TOML190 TaxID=2931351 RepID=UPI0020402B8C|nr:hypothetical protein [Kangiella sp. TOML190]